jgi:hypothetical protein
MNTWQDHCGVCLGTRWWPSRIYGLKICWWCSGGNPMTALITLARYGGPDAVQAAQRWADRVREFNELSQKYADSIENSRGMP